jgi:MFS family permease
MVTKIGIVSAIMSALLAWLAPNHAWFYLIFFLIGIANVANWTIGIIMSLEFSANDTDRPTYIGLANTLVAPANILAPFLGGWIAQTSSYPITFLVSALIGGLTLLVFQLFVKDPRKLRLPALA